MAATARKLISHATSGTQRIQFAVLWLKTPMYSAPNPLRANWFAAFTMSNHEKAVGRYLDAIGLECYVPLLRRRHDWKNRTTVEVDEVLFPNHVFVKVDRKSLVNVARATGVMRIVGSLRDPAPLPEADIECLRSGLHLRKVGRHPFLSAGDKARIRSGPLTGITGVLLYEENELRLVLSINMIMQSIFVEVAVDEVEPID